MRPTGPESIMGKPVLSVLLLTVALSAALPQGTLLDRFAERFRERRQGEASEREEQEQPAPRQEEDFDRGDEVPKHHVQKLVDETPFRLKEGLESYALKSYDEITSESRENVIFSPFSLHTALSMVYFGSPAESQTHEEMARLLGLVNDERQGQYAVNYLQLLLRYDNLRMAFDTAVEFANRIFLAKNFSIKPDYKLLMQSYYLTDLTTTDFSKSVQAAKEINEWVSQKTHGKITDLLSPQNVNDLTRMVIVNAIYFKANWKFQFNAQQTRNKEFYIEEGQEPINHQAMRLQGLFYGAELPELNARVLELLYEDEDFRMLIFLPNVDSSIQELDQAMGKLDLDRLDRKLVEGKYRVQLPKFKIEAGLDMKEILQSMGIRTLFDTPDLSDIAESEYPGGNLRVTDVLHKAAVEVSEQGTEAAAATAVGIGIRTSRPKNSGGDFIVNRPFTFIIQDRKLGVPLFMGRIVDPTGRKVLSSSRGRRDSSPSLPLSTSDLLGERGGDVQEIQRRPEEIHEAETEHQVRDCPEGYTSAHDDNISFPCRERDTMVLEQIEREKQEILQRRRERALGLN